MKPVIGITIATPGYFDLAQEAAARFRKYADTEVLILTSNVTDGYDQKFNILNVAGDRTVVFFDSDWWAVRPFDVQQFYNSSLIWAVKDASRHSLSSFCLHDAMTLGFPAEEYVNTGFFVVNGREASHHRAFGQAALLVQSRKAGEIEIKDRTEQSLLNAAWQRDNLTIQYLPDEWNYWPRAIERGFYTAVPTDPIAIHAADVELRHKIEFLYSHCQFYDSDSWKALRRHLPKQIELAK